MTTLCSSSAQSETEGSNGVAPLGIPELASTAQMATPETLRSFCRLDRAALGRHCRLLQTRKQGRPRLCRRPEQQDPRHPRRAYGLHDEEYLKLKVLTCTLPAI